jgi:metal-responsive CopG/Arc/MetJ family transcriptional regulator
LVEYGAVRLSLDLLKQVTDTISETKLWINETDFVRDAVREKIVAVNTTKLQTKGVAGI